MACTAIALKIARKLCAGHAAGRDLGDPALKLRWVAEQIEKTEIEANEQ